MKKIDTKEWTQFFIGQLFDVVKGKRLTKSQMLPGNTRFIGASSVNNGCTSLIGNHDNIHPANTLTVCYNGSVGATFYQDEPFIASDDVNVLYPKFPLTRNIGLFLVPLIEFIGRQYSFVNKWVQEDMVNAPILLPVNSTGEPDWNYMDSFMCEVVNESSRILDSCRNVSFDANPVTIDGWVGFRIDDLFKVVKGSRLKRADMIEGTTPFIGACITNNGISNRVGNVEHVHQGNLITVAYDGAVATGKAFYQPSDFWASDSVAVLYPRFDLNQDIALFLIPLIEKAGEKYHYDEKWTKPEMEQSVIYIPVTDDGTPDWEYMETYIQDLLAETDTRLADLQNVAE